MSSPTRRSVLRTVALVASTAVLPKEIQAKVGAAVLPPCPTCGADLNMGDLHKAGCEAANVSPPRDDEIRPEATKIEERVYAQEPSGCGARGYDVKGGSRSRDDEGCGSRGYDLKNRPPSRGDTSGCGSRGYDLKGRPLPRGEPGCTSRG